MDHVAIVGGGVSGLYSAWRLKLRDPKARIVVYECSDYRTGGRLMSAIPPGMPHVPAELGGMRFLNTHVIVKSFADKFGIAYHDFPVSEANNVAYLRGVHLQRSDLTNPAKVPYRMQPDEAGLSIGQLMAAAMERIVPGVTSSALTQDQRRAMAQATVFDGRPLYQWGFWNALTRVLSFEAYQFVADASGYDTTVSNWNAADAIPWFLADFGADATYLNPLKGMQIFPDTIRAMFEDRGGEVRLNSKVTRVSRAGKGVRLEFDQSNGKMPPVDAARVVLAMPRRSLELIDLAPAFEKEMPRVAELIAAVSPQPLFKLFACYHEPWWRTILTGERKPWWREPLTGIRQGQSTTDIPIRQTYYFGTENEQPGGEPENTNSLLMATYDDGRNIKYWIGFLREAESAPRYAGAGGGDEQWRHNEPPQSMVDEVHRLLAEMHGVPAEDVPKPYAAAYRDWGIDPFGGGYNVWKINARSPQVMHDILHPVRDVPVYVCGEAYSNEQGWVEGALETAETMLERCFDLGPPDWLERAPAQPRAMATESATTRI
jgi:monoamine oxidase